MLPKNYVKDDASWLLQQMMRLPPKHRDKARIGYDTVWQQAWHAEPNPHMRENKARFAANTRLRKYVDRVTGSRI